MFFKKRKKNAPPCLFQWGLTDNAAITFQLTQGGKIVPIEGWSYKADTQSFAGISLLSGELEAQEEQPDNQQLLTQIDENTLQADPQWIAGLNILQSEALNLPETVPFLLDIDHQGTLDQPEFRFTYNWMRANGQAVLGAKRQGALLRIGSRHYRITEPFFSLLDGMDAFNATPPRDMDERFLAWGKLSTLLPGEAIEAIQTHGYLQNTKVVHASAFTLNITQDENEEFIFDPQLVEPPQALSSFTPGAFSIVPKKLLSNEHAQIFARRFRESSQARYRYVLQEGHYVVLDEVLKRALEVVHESQHTTHAARRQFAKNPRAFLREALGDIVDDETLEMIFVETPEYSQRVKDIGLWEEKVLPLVQQDTETWMPPEAMSHSKMESGEPSESEGGGESEPQQKITLQIADNILEINYLKNNWKPREPQLVEEPPKFMKSTLKPHQEAGLQWMQRHWNCGSPGGLLADDMGLGKTFQALTFIAWLKQAMREQLIENLPLMIVAPTGLLRNWEQENKIHFEGDGLGKLQRAYGKYLQELRTEFGDELNEGLPLLDKEKLQSADWILSTYETIRDYQHSFGGIQFGAIVFDEVQKIKTPGTLMTEASKAMNTEFILAMTGTPIENRLSDLWCIIDTVCPGYMGDLKGFSRRFEKDRDNMAQLKEMLTAEQDNMPAIMLRRMKEDHLSGFPEVQYHQLPESPATPSMPAIQVQRYNEVIYKQASAEVEAGAALEALQQLRMVSLHPYPRGQMAADETDATSASATTPPSSFVDDDYILQSARLAKTFELLDEIQKNNEKALIFLESQEMQRNLMLLIHRRYRVKPLLINGSVAGAKRQTRVNRFQEGDGFDVFIISPLAGGVGLTLTAANHVIHLTRWWNPAVEDQCTCRAYRLGQTKTVHVYYPMAIHPKFKGHSFDWRLHNLLETKRTLSRDMLLPPMAKDEDIKQLYEDTIGAEPSAEPTVTEATAQQATAAPTTRPTPVEATPESQDS